MIRLFPEGFEEVAHADAVELAAYTDGDGEARMRAAFPEASAADVADDWHSRWRSFHRSVRLGPLWVGPPWETPPAGALAVAIEPGRAFGTGAHPTTRLVLELLVGCAPTSLLDVGCGSGVLAVAAGLLGFRPVLAVDVDPAAVEATAANAAANGVAVDARLLNALADPLPAAELALANVALDAVERLAARLESTTVITSGYLASDQPLLRGFRHLERRENDGWAADVYARETQ